MRDGRIILLRDETGERLRDRGALAPVVRDAHARFLVGLDRAVVQSPDTDQMPITKVSQLYLSHCEATGAESTRCVRADTSFDFYYGRPAAFREKIGKGCQKSRREIDAARIHSGYGILGVCDLKPLGVDQWLQANPSWGGCRRTKVQALKRALYYAVGS